MAVEAMAAASFVWPTPRSVYLHVPFCRHRCGYCNFSVVADRDDLIDRYLDAIDCELASLDRPVVNTVFIGGGTPTHLPPVALSKLLAIAKQRFQFEGDVEFSTEANPEDITAEKLDCLVHHGVNRISLGVQSFNDDKLRLLERGHTGGRAAAMIELAASRIPNVSIDLIFAAPGETTEQWQQDLSTALSLPIQHISTYALTFEKGTSFWSRLSRGDLSTTDEAIEVEMYQAGRRMTAEAGLSHYEISNFARAGHRCRHNLAYWDGQGWYAAGPGAARFVGGRREVNHRSTTTYIKRMESGQTPTAESELISPLQCARERAAFGVRLIDGVDIDAIGRETGIPIREACSDAIAGSFAEGLLEEAGGRMRLTDRGVLFADTVASRFLG
ncbi:radical SAM family heme chaperone HemW [Rubripirellula reticaptiva]|uniref:Heme chaperone HemW n=1 Tax=Rubripirellula reticaptiva TaxID=2528013 RepID=A0A5C6F7V9_9BACT|nr:radical SAM family heme chaperone HemW [Rubripirellula reticaptiva]TWU56176.1 Oxygen-independent coproporphyrinogen-III oxidase-like protein [Rubripirellula reticaptiva]